MIAHTRSPTRVATVDTQVGRQRLERHQQIVQQISHLRKDNAVRERQLGTNPAPTSSSSSDVPLAPSERARYILTISLQKKTKQAPPFAKLTSRLATACTLTCNGTSSSRVLYTSALRIYDNNKKQERQEFFAFVLFTAVNHSCETDRRETEGLTERNQIHTAHGQVHAWSRTT